MFDAELMKAEDLAKWRARGFLHIEGVLSTSEVSRCEEVLRRIDGLSDGQSDVSELNFGDAGNARDVNVLDVVSEFPELAFLIDHRNMFGQVLGLMGPYIQVVGTELMIRYPSPEPLLKLHTDGGPSLRGCYPSNDSRVLHLKANFILSDTSEPNRGNFRVVPGSHMREFPRSAEAIDSARDFQICARPGDVVLFPWSLWHGVASHRGSKPRFGAIVRYAQMWARPCETRKVPTVELSGLSERQRRLLGSLSREGASEDYDFYRCRAERHLDIMYGTEWSGCAEYSAYRESEEFGKEYYK